MCPGKKEFVSFKVDDMKQHFQKLLINIKNLKIDDYLKLGFSKFCELRPKWPIPVDGVSVLHAVCVCKYHQKCNAQVSSSVT